MFIGPFFIDQIGVRIATAGWVLAVGAAAYFAASIRAAREQPLGRSHSSPAWPKAHYWFGDECISGRASSRLSGSARCQFGDAHAWLEIREGLEFPWSRQVYVRRGDENGGESMVRALPRVSIGGSPELARGRNGSGLRAAIAWPDGEQQTFDLGTGGGRGPMTEHRAPDGVVQLRPMWCR
jgi:hypothetical protein